MYTRTHTMAAAAAAKQSPLKQTLLLPKSYYVFCGAPTTISYENKHNTHTQTSTNTHTYGNTVAADAHSAYACDNSDSAASTTPSGSRERESMRERQKFTLAALLAAGDAARSLSLSAF